MLERVIASTTSLLRGRRPESSDTGLGLLMLSNAPSLNAGTRIFCDIPAGRLGEHGIAATVCRPATSRLFAALIEDKRLGYSLGATVYWYGLVLPARIWQLTKVLTADAVFIQRGLFRYNSPPILESLIWAITRRIGGGVVIYHLDDAMYAVSKRYARKFRTADVVITGNGDIAATATRAGARVRMIEAGLPIDEYPVKVHSDVAPVVIGWTGHFAQERLSSVGRALETISAIRNVRVRVVADHAPTDIPFQGVMEYERWSFPRRFDLFLDFDIGIMPLADTPYNRGKEAFKVKEYMAAGLPVVCSAVGHNVVVVDPEVTGLFASNDGEWIRQILRLVDSVELRRSMGAAGRARVEANFGMDRYVAEFAAVVKNECAARRSERCRPQDRA